MAYWFSKLLEYEPLTETLDEQYFRVKRTSTCIMTYFKDTVEKIRRDLSFHYSREHREQSLASFDTPLDRLERFNMSE